MDNEQLIQQFYLAYYGRPADPGGLDFWLNAFDSGATEAELIASFGSPEQPEFVGIYGMDPSPAEFFTIAYRNILNREPDAEGLDYWLGVYDAELNRLTSEQGLSAGAATDQARAFLLSEFIGGVAGGSQQDQWTLANQLELSMQTTELARTLPDSTIVTELVNFVRDDAFLQEDIWQEDNFLSHVAAIQVYNQENGGAPVNFTLREVVVTETENNDLTVDITPQEITQTYWGDPTNVVDVDANNPNADDGVVFTNAVPVGELLLFLDGFLTDRTNLLEQLDIQTELDRIVDITIEGALDPIQDDGLADDGGNTINVDRQRRGDGGFRRQCRMGEGGVDVNIE